jgi:N utilization substance protein B
MYTLSGVVWIFSCPVCKKETGQDRQTPINTNRWQTETHRLEEPNMTRTAAREIAIHCSYSLGFSHQTASQFLEERLNRDTFLRWGEENPLYREYPNEKQLQYIQDVVRGVADHGPELDQYIAQYAKNWTFERIPRTAAAIMRVAMYEILYMPNIPSAAAINDAVEITKKYEDDKVVSFVNGILGAFIRAEFPEENHPAPAPKED